MGRDLFNLFLFCRVRKQKSFSCMDNPQFKAFRIDGVAKAGQYIFGAPASYIKDKRIAGLYRYAGQDTFQGKESLLISVYDLHIKASLLFYPPDKLPAVRGLSDNAGGNGPYLPHLM